MMIRCPSRSSSRVKCWGANYNGALGDGTTTHRFTPVDVSDLTGAVAIAMGLSNACAILESGAMVCWGYNSSGQLGHGTTVDAWTPVSVLGITNATQVHSYSSHVCALLETGSLRCWGNGAGGKLGNDLSMVADLQSEAGLAGATGTDQGHQARASQCGLHFCQLALAADEAREV